MLFTVFNAGSKVFLIL